MSKYDLIEGKINIGDTLVHSLSLGKWTVVCYDEKDKEYTLRWDKNDKEYKYHNDIVKQCFIRYETYIKRKQELALQKIADEIKQMFTKKAN